MHDSSQGSDYIALPIVSDLEGGLEYRGVLEVFSDFQFRGWCFSSRSISSSVKLILYVNGINICEAISENPRLDIENILGQKNQCGYVFDLLKQAGFDRKKTLNSLLEAQRISASVPITVEVMIAGTAVRMSKSPRLFFSSSDLDYIIETISVISAVQPAEIISQLPLLADNIKQEFRAIAALAENKTEPIDGAAMSGFPLVHTPELLGRQQRADATHPETPRKPKHGVMLLSNGLDVLQLPAVTDLDRVAGFVHVFSRLCGTTAVAEFTVAATGGEAVVALPAPLPGSPVLTDAEFIFGPRRIRDLWFASTLDLTLCLGDVGDGELVSGESLRAYQFDLSEPARLRRVGAVNLEADSPVFVTLSLDNPWRSVLLELCNPGGSTRALGVIGFPSLARGGAHHAELLSAGEGLATFEHLTLYSEARAADVISAVPTARVRRLGIRLDGAMSTEAGLQAAALTWIRSFGIQTFAVPSGQDSDAYRAGALGLHLSLHDNSAPPDLAISADSMPTIAALTGAAFADESAASADQPRLASFLVADEGTGRPRWAVTLPDNPLLLSLQTDNGMAAFPVLTGMPRAIAPVCIRLRPCPSDWPTDQLLPVSVDASVPLLPRLTGVLAGQTLCVFEATDLQQTERFLATMMAQDGSERLSFAILPSPRLSAEALNAVRVLADYFVPGRTATLLAASGPLPGVAQLLAASEGAETIFLSRDSVILHDNRALQTLLQLLFAKGIASAACVLMHESTEASASVFTHAESGYFPDRVGLAGGPHVVMGLRPGVLDALPEATFPVMANTMNATLLSRTVLVETGLARLDAAAFGLATARMGYLNLCTSIVRGTTIRRLATPDVMDPLGFRRLSQGQWPDILARVTLLEELR